MNNYASKSLCEELYKLSGWTDTTFKYDKPSLRGLEKQGVYTQLRNHANFIDSEELPPAYDLGYLIRKLPHFIDTKDARGTFELFIKKTHSLYFAGYNKPELGKWLYDQNHAVWEHPAEADTPENALCLLLIQLIKDSLIEGVS